MLSLLVFYLHKIKSIPLSASSHSPLRRGENSNTEHLLLHPLPLLRAYSHSCLTLRHHLLRCRPHPGLHFSLIRSNAVVAFRPAGHVHVCGLLVFRPVTCGLKTSISGLLLYASTDRTSTTIFSTPCIRPPIAGKSSIILPSPTLSFTTPLRLRGKVPLLRLPNTLLTPATTPSKSPSKKTPKLWQKWKNHAVNWKKLAPVVLNKKSPSYSVR